MSGETAITLEGNLTGDPELRFTPSGAAVATFTVASTPQKYNQQTREWEDLDTLFLRCQVWRDQAENVAESLTKGMAVIVVGTLGQRSYETREGDKRTVYEVEAKNVGPSLRRASAKVTKATPTTAGKAAPGQGDGWGSAAPQDDPWGGR